MRDALDHSPGERLGVDEYNAAVGERFWDIRQFGFWKLERQQTFAEPDDPSWVAFDRGDWGLALQLIAQRRGEFEDDRRRMRETGFSSYRVRVVEEPLTPYLQWELQLLRLMGSISDEIRVLDAAHVRDHESGRPLPELVTVEHDLTFEVLYDGNGVLSGAVRHVGTEITTVCREFIQSLYAAGENVVSYVDREVAGLPPPTRR